MAAKKKKKSKLSFIIRSCLTLMILACLLWISYIFTGKALCHIALKQIAELTDTRITTKSVIFNPRGSVNIENLTIHPKDINSDSVSIVNARKVYVKFGVRSLFRLKPSIEIIDVNDFIFNAHFNHDTGKSNLAGLKMKFLENKINHTPFIHLRDGILRYSNIYEGEEQITVSIPLTADFTPAEQPQKSYKFDIQTATLSSGYGTSHLNGSWKPGILTIAGGISSLDVPELEMAWWIDTLAAVLEYDNNKDFTLDLRIKNLGSKRSESLQKVALFRPVFFEKSGMFNALNNFFNQYQPTGLVDITLNSSGNLLQPDGTSLNGTITCKDAAFCCSRLPYTLENVEGEIQFTQDSITLNKLTGTHGDNIIELSGWTRDYGQNRQYNINIASDSMLLDDDLYNAFSEERQRLWSYFQPSGHAAVDLQLIRTSPADRRIELALGLLDVNAVYCNFPYPLQNLTGLVTIGQQGVTFSDVFYSRDNTNIMINGNLSTTEPDKPVCNLSIDLNNLPLNSTLADLLPEKQQELFNTINPTGFADGHVNVQTQQETSKKVFEAELSFRNASLQFGQLNQPVTDISAEAVFTDDTIEITSFSGLYNKSSISASGNFRQQDDRQSAYDLSVSLEEMELNQGFMDLIPDSAADKILQLQPTGKVNIDADISRESADQSPVYDIKLFCLNNSITYQKFPYIIRNIKGNVLINKSGITFNDVTASLDGISTADVNDGTVSLEGTMQITEDYINNISLAISANNIAFEQNLTDILPVRLHKLYSKFSPDSRLNLELPSFNLSRDKQEITSVDFEGRASLEGCELKLINEQAQLDIELRTKGLYQAGAGLVENDTVIENGTIRILGKSFTNLKAEININPDLQSLQTDGFIADCYGGEVTGKFALHQSPDNNQTEYTLETAYDKIDINRFLADSTNRPAGDSYTKGNMNGYFSLKGQLADSVSRIGLCNLKVINMKAGNLSLLGRLINVLNLAEPSRFVFDEMLVDSYLSGHNLIIKKLDLSGQSTAFTGSGQMDIATRNIDLILTARGKRSATAEPSLLDSLTEGLGQGVVRVDVTGKFDNPIVTTKTLPVIEQTLQILGSKTQNTQ